MRGSVALRQAAKRRTVRRRQAQVAGCTWTGSCAQRSARSVAIWEAPSLSAKATKLRRTLSTPRSWEPSVLRSFRYSSTASRSSLIAHLPGQATAVPACGGRRCRPWHKSRSCSERGGARSGRSRPGRLPGGASLWPGNVAADALLDEGGSARPSSGRGQPASRQCLRGPGLGEAPGF